MRDEPYTYETAGFSAFLLRSHKSNPGARTLRGGISRGAGGPISFDRIGTDGSIGDRVRVGSRIILDGTSGRVIFLDETGSTEIGWAGDLTEA